MLMTYTPEVMRGIRLDAFTRHMDSLQGQLPMVCSTGPNNIRIWTFNRTDFSSPKDGKENFTEMGEGNFNAPTHHDATV